MSSVAGFCSRCGYTDGELTEQQKDVMRMRGLRDKSYHLRMWSYAVVTVFMGGFGWFWWSSVGFENRPASGSFVLMAITAIVYLLLRSRIFSNRQQQKALRKKSRKNPA
jgi:sulfite exporter TauE/SafE